MTRQKSWKRPVSARAVGEPLESRTLFAILYVCDNLGNLAAIDTTQASIHTPAIVIKNTGVGWNDVAFSPQGVLYGIDNSSNTDLFRIDPLIGAATYIGSLGTQVNSLAFSKGGILYAANDSLWQVNTSSGSATRVTTLGGFQSAGDLAFDDTGNLFLSTTSGELLKLNPNAGALTDVGPLGDDDIEALAYADHTLYGIIGGSDALVAIDTASGQASFLGIYTGFGSITGADSIPASLLPQPPTSVSATQGITTDRVLLTWQPAPNAISYDVWRSTIADSPSAAEIAVGVTGTTFSDTAVDPNTTYYYWADATTPLGTSHFSTATSGFSASTQPLLAPTNVTGSAGKFADRIHISWSASGGAQWYDVWRSASPDFLSAIELPVDVITTYYDDTAAQPGTIYYYWVTANNQLTQSSVSAQASDALTLISSKQLRQVMPSLSVVDADRYVGPMSLALDEFGVNTWQREAAFLSQVAAETAQLSPQWWDEHQSSTSGINYINYTIFGRNKQLVRTARAAGMTHLDDGLKYHGRGPLQLTWRVNYQAASRALFRDDRLVAQPTLVSDPYNPLIGFRVAAWYFNTHVLKGITANAAAAGVVESSRSSIKATNHLITHIVNGGANGEATRLKFYDRALKILAPPNARVV